MALNHSWFGVNNSRIFGIRKKVLNKFKTENHHFQHWRSDVSNRYSRYACHGIPGGSEFYFRLAGQVFHNGTTFAVFYAVQQQL